MNTKQTLAMTLALAFAASVALRAEDAKPAAAASAAPAAKADAPAEGAPAAEAKAEATPVAKNDAPGSVAPGNGLNDEGKFAEAIAYFEGIGEQVAANGHMKREPWRLVGLAKANIGLKKFDDAAKNAQAAVDIDGKNGVAWNLLGSALAQSGKRADAIAAYNKGIAAVKAAKGDTSKLEANLAALNAAVEASKPKAQKTAEAAAAAAAAAAATSGTAAAAAPAAAAKAEEKK